MYAQTRTWQYFYVNEINQIDLDYILLADQKDMSFDFTINLIKTLIQGKAESFWRPLICVVKLDIVIW